VITDCGDWCKQDAESSWELKCTYDSCRGCGDCFGTALPSDGEVSQIASCGDWCKDNAGEGEGVTPWEQVCEWGDCKGCDECSDDKNVSKSSSSGGSSSSSSSSSSSGSSGSGSSSESPAKEAPAEPLAPKTDFAAELADKLANGGMLEPQFTCAAESIANTVPSLDADPLGGMLAPKGWPAKHAKWLFYGPSYMNQAFQAVVASASTVTDIKSVEDAGEAFPQVSDCPHSAAANASHEAFRMLEWRRQLTCNWENAHDTTCHGAPASSSPSTRVTFANGAEMWGLNNAPVFQDESRSDSMAALEELLGKHDFDLIFYMAPHGALYFEEHCAAIAQHRPVDSDKTEGDEHDDSNMCLPRAGGPEPAKSSGGPITSNPVTTEQYLGCAEKRRSFQIIETHAKKRKAKLVKVLPWQVNPQGEAAGKDVYLSFPAAWKYPCTGASLSVGAPGIAEGPCSGGGFKQGPEMAEFRKGHPCTVVCEKGTDRCVLGASALMAMEMVNGALGEPLVEDYSDSLDWQPRIAHMCSY